MAGKVDIVALGELLIDFTEAGFSANGQKLFEQNPGGAPANLLTVASHFGFQTAFIGKIGKDMQGEFLKKSLQSEQIDTRALVEDENYFTTLAFVELDKTERENFLLQENREPIRSFARMNWIESFCSIVKYFISAHCL